MDIIEEQLKHNLLGFVMRKSLTKPSMIFLRSKKRIFIIMFLLFFAVATFQERVFCDAPEYLPPRGKLDEASLAWRNNPVGILKFYSVYNKPIVIREKPDANSKRLLSCLKIADCGFNFVAASGYIHDIKDLFMFLDYPELPSYVSVELVVTEKKGNWYKIVYHTEWGKEGWVYFGDVNGDNYDDRNRISFTPIEDFFKNAMAVYFLNDPERNEYFLEIKGRPEENSVTVTKVTVKDSLVLIGKPKFKGDWAKVQVVRYDECESTHCEQCEKSDTESECPWGWVRWRSPEGLLLMWIYWWDTC